MPANPKVLIVDEDLDSRVETRKVLQRAQFQVSGEVGFGTEAVSFANEHRPDVILVAVEEPVARPLDTMEALANVLPDTPVIFYASLNEPEAIRRAVHFGARDYLLKPLQAGSLRPAVIRALEFEEKRHMRQAGQLAGTPVRGTVITVAGAKGGIGKSVIAVNLALALQGNMHAKVVIVDADTSFGDVATMLDLTPVITAGELLRNIDNVDRVEISDYLVPFGQGLSVLAAPVDDINPWEAAGPAAGRRIIDLLSLSYDFVVVDTNGSMDSYSRAMIEGSTLILLVTTGEVSSVRDTRAALSRLKVWEVPDERIKVVLNRGARADGFQVKDVESTLSRPIFWEMPRDKAVGFGVQIGRPVVLQSPKSPAARNLLALAGTIGGNVGNGATPNGDHSPGLFGRFRSNELAKEKS